MTYLLDILFFHYVFDRYTMEIGFNVNPAVAKMTIGKQHMARYVPGIIRGLDNASKTLLNAREPTIIKKPTIFLQDFVSYMTVPTLVGEEVATNPEVIRSFSDFTGDITGNVGIFLTVPESLHYMILPYLQSVSKHHKIMEEHIMPVLHQRREKMKAAEEVGKEHGLENNFLQGLMEWVTTDEQGNKSSYTDEQLSHAVLLIAFASVHTTSSHLSYCLYWLIARPDLKKRLMEEIERVLPGDSPITHEALGQMEFMNNLVRESLRQGTDKLANRKKAMKDFTFYNGYQVPAGRVVETNLRQLNFGSNQTRSTIEGMDPDMSRNKSSTTPAKDFVTFGMGKHLCPGKMIYI
jgi:cytochrome P450